MDGFGGLKYIEKWRNLSCCFERAIF